MSYQNYHTTVLWHPYNKASITTNFYKLFCLCSVVDRLLASCRPTLQFCMAISLQMWKLRSPFVFSLKRFLPFRQPLTLTLLPLPIKSTFPPLSVLSSFITYFYKNAFQDTWCFILLPTLLLSFKSFKIKA